jgi:hypothetical protein
MGRAVFSMIFMCLIRQHSRVCMDPALTDGLDMNSVLEILILDSLEDGVSALVYRGCGRSLTAAVCGRDHYLDANFDHTMLGGRSGMSGALGEQHRRLTNYSCNRMRQVWDAAKCYNFQTRSLDDGFFIFDQYRATRGCRQRDYRQLPVECTDLDTDLAHDVACNYHHPRHSASICLIPPGWPWGGGVRRRLGLRRFRRLTRRPGRRGARTVRFLILESS